MRLKLLAIGLLLTISACKSMNERNTASLDPQAESEHTTPSKETPLDKYYQSIVKNLKVEVADRGNNRWDRCDDDGESCLSATCKKGGYSCSSSYDLNKVVELCKDSDGNCVNAVCSQGGYSCSSSYDLNKVVALCKESRGSCVKAVCKPGGYSCSSSYDLNKVIAVCTKDVDSRCITDICAQGGYSCSSSYDLNKVISMCTKK